MKVEMTASNGWNYLRLAAPAIKDISSYEAIEFYVYNDSDQYKAICLNQL